jgi:tetratricopeptide (TPR) repeat protein
VTVIRLLVVAICMCSSAPLSAQPVKQLPKLSWKIKDLTIGQANLKAYQSLLRRYCASDPAALDRLLSWEHDALLDAVMLINSSSDDTRPWAVEDIKAAALMHVEAVARLLREHGNRQDNNDISLHLDLGSRVLVRGIAPLLQETDPRFARQRADIRGFSSRWYVATSRLLRDRTRFNVARNFLALGRERLPDDAAVLYESGTTEELIATHPSRQISRDLAGSPFSSTDSVAKQLLSEHGDQLLTAERWLRESLTRDPGRLDTQLHLGRVLMLLGRDDEALPMLDHAAAGAPLVAYLAHLFRGAIEERRGNLDAAADAYGTATAMDPGRQSALIALSQVLQRQGRGERSRALLDQLLTRGAPDEDPWWQYFFDLARVVISRLSALFAEISQ